MKIAASTEEKNGICWFYRNTQAGAKGNFAKLQHVSLSASVHCSSFRAHSHFCAGKEKGERGPCSSSSHLDCLCEIKIVFLQLNVPNVGHNQFVCGDALGAVGQGSSSVTPFMSFSYTWEPQHCSERHRKGRGTGEVGLTGETR